MFDMAVLADEIAAIVREEVAQALAPWKSENDALTKRIADLEGRGDPAPIIGEAVARAVAALPAPEAPAVDLQRISGIVDESVAKAVAAIPPAEPGKDVDPSVVASLVDDAVTRAVSALPAPAAGRDADMGEVASLVRSVVAKAVDEVPVLKGDDGAGIGDLLIDRSGDLVATFTDGRTKNLGQIVGKDGLDGLSADDVSCELAEDGRTVAFKLLRGNVERSFSLAFPVVLDRGVYQERAYDQGDAVTWAGSLWIAQRSTSAKPDSPESGWRLAVKRGRDGKDRPAGVS